MRPRPWLFLDLCCGMGGMSLTLQGGCRCKPPGGYQGGKAAYAPSILQIMGLHPGQGADRVLLVDADPALVRMWRLLGAAPGRAAALEIAEGWLGQRPRALWDSLWTVEPDTEARAVMRWLLLRVWSGPDADPTRGKRDGYLGPDRPGRPGGVTLPGLVARVRALPDLEALQHDLATGLPPGLPEDLTGAVVYVDPDYQHTSGYRHTLPRPAVLALAQQAIDRGAAVYVSEAEPLPLSGGYPVEITTARQGNGRRWSRQQAEYLTCSVAPAWTPAAQGALFGAAA